MHLFSVPCIFNTEKTKSLYVDRVEYWVTSKCKGYISLWDYGEVCFKDGITYFNLFTWNIPCTSPPSRLTTSTKHSVGLTIISNYTSLTRTDIRLGVSWILSSRLTSVYIIVTYSFHIPVVSCNSHACSTQGNSFYIICFLILEPKFTEIATKSLLEWLSWQGI